MRAAHYAIKPDLPYTPGADAAGVIDQVGAASIWTNGDRRVRSAAPRRGKAQGAYRSLSLASLLENHVGHRLPDRIS